MIYTYCNIEEVLSCRFIWGNSNVSIFSFSLIYTLRKGILAFLLPGAIYFSIFLFLMEDNKNNETEQVTEQVKANAKPSASEKKDAKDKEVVMVCEYIEKEIIIFTILNSVWPRMIIIWYSFQRME